MNPTNDSLQILPTYTAKNNRLKRANTFTSNSQIDFSSQATKDHSEIQWGAARHESFRSMSMTDINADSSMKEYQTVKSSSQPLLVTEDEDDEEFLSNEKTFVDQGSQAVLGELKAKKKKKKIKSSPRRAKPVNTPQIPAATNRLTSSGDLINPTKSAVTLSKTEENNGTKSLITVDTSKARSNLEVVRLCIRELGWKEVQIILISFFYISSF